MLDAQTTSCGIPHRTRNQRQLRYIVCAAELDHLRRGEWRSSPSAVDPALSSFPRRPAECAYKVWGWSTAWAGSGIASAT